MKVEDIEKIVGSRGMVYRGKFLKQLSQEEFNNGMRKVDLQSIDDLDSLIGEECWAWLNEEDRLKYDNDENGIVKAILANQPINYMGILFWGSEIVLRLNGGNRPTLSKEWITKNIGNNK